MTAQDKKERVFSGVQPTGTLHLGNYLGALKHFVALQERYDCIYSIVDLHAITLRQDPKELASHTRRTAAVFLACGIDPARHIIFNQSRVSAHAELAWILNCTVRIGWLNRMTQFKDKAGRDRENASVGLYVYPVLMAADILAYRAEHVPVGDDQKQHLELVRDIAQKFNTDYGVDFFPLPEPLIPQEAARVMSLRDGTQKMSKSDASDMSRIVLGDDADRIQLKIRKARTDTDPLPDTPAGLKGRAEAANLAGLCAVLAGEDIAASLARLGGADFATLKKELTERLVARLCPIADEMRRFESDPAQLDRILMDGAARADALSAPVLARVKEIVGFVSG